MKELTEEEFMLEIYSDIWEQEKQMLLKEDAHNQRLFRAVKSVRGDQFKVDLEFIFNEIGGYAFIEIVRKPKGRYQKEDYGLITGAWVDQYSTGDSGDDFYGDVYVEIKPGKYLKMHYAS